MTASETIDLGAGACVSLHADGALEVASERVALPWHPRGGVLPGTAVVWRDEMYEVLGGGPVRWRLAEWPHGSVARQVFVLDAASLAHLAAEARAAGERERCRQVLSRTLPLAGFAPTAVQRRWESELGVRAWRATVASAIVEALAGTAGLIQLMTLAASGWWLPAWLHALAYAGPLLVAEGFFRLAFAMSHAQPRGSLVTLPWAWWEERQARLAARPARPRPPVVTRLDVAAGILELQTGELRRDWDAGGVLAHRGRVWRLAGLASHAAPWVYRFTAAAEADGPGTLRLVPPPVRAPVPAAGGRGSGRAVGRHAWEAILASLAPRAVQERWAAANGASPAAMSAVSAAIELAGGCLNLFVRRLPASPWTLLDTVLVLDGALRLAVVLASGRACGSVLVAPWRAAVSRRLRPQPAAPDTVDSPRMATPPRPEPPDRAAAESGGKETT